MKSTQAAGSVFPSCDLPSRIPIIARGRTTRRTSMPLPPARHFATCQHLKMQVRWRHVKNPGHSARVGPANGRVAGRMRAPYQAVHAEYMDAHSQPRSCTLPCISLAAARLSSSSAACTIGGPMMTLDRVDMSPPFLSLSTTRWLPAARDSTQHSIRVCISWQLAKRRPLLRYSVAGVPKDTSRRSCCPVRHWKFYPTCGWALMRSAGGGRRARSRHQAVPAIWVLSVGRSSYGDLSAV